jgi:NifU-like protein involved in Fe-S cluster formation
MARNVVGSTAEELRSVRQQMYAMLKENGPAPEGKWKDLEALTPVRDFKARHASTLLTFDAVVDAVDQIEAKTKEQVSGS